MSPHFLKTIALYSLGTGCINFNVARVQNFGLFITFLSDCVNDIRFR